MTTRRRGMTLMELVVGLAITGVMAATGAAAFGSIIDHRRAIKESTVGMERASALREQLRQWIGSGTVLIQQGGVPNVGGRTSVASSTASTISAAASTGDEISVNTSAWNPAMTPSVRMRIFVDGDEGTPERGLTVEYQSSNQAPLQRRELDRTIGGMTVEFLDQRTGRWRPWAEQAAIQPIAVRLWLLPLQGQVLPSILQLPMVFKMGTQ
jgi:prepilin-type N-terminal cleavage/methylation domain-containing protein